MSLPKSYQQLTGRFVDMHHHRLVHLALAHTTQLHPAAARGDVILCASRIRIPAGRRRALRRLPLPVGRLPAEGGAGARRRRLPAMGGPDGVHGPRTAGDVRGILALGRPRRVLPATVWEG